jgi:hypothetical protein
MRGMWKRGMASLVRHWQTKGPETDRRLLNYRATSRLYLYQSLAQSKCDCKYHVVFVMSCGGCAKTTTEGNHRQNAPAVGSSLPHAGEAEGMPVRRRAPNAGLCAYMHRDAAQEGDRLDVLRGRQESQGDRDEGAVREG